MVAFGFSTVGAHDSLVGPGNVEALIECAHGTPLHSCPATIAFSDVHEPSQLGGPSNGVVSTLGTPHLPLRISMVEGNSVHEPSGKHVHASHLAGGATSLSNTSDFS
jgi:hypothetical protein